jgi:2-succinyl-6-hydroxy-2,4-cyclohexadiene-1-carboxylate synthase
LLVRSPELFLEKWMRQPLFDPQSPALARSVSDPKGLSRIFLEASQAENNDLWDRLKDLKCNLTYVVGERDTKYIEIARRIVDVRPSTKVITIPNGYHDVHRTHPSEVAKILRGVL